MEGDGAANNDGGGCMSVPVDGQEYPVALGRSLLGPLDGSEVGDGSAPREVYTTFRYDFQPASIDKTSPGLVSMDESKGVQVLLASATGAPGGVLFKGKAVDNKDTDCLLLFDGRSFRLERSPFSCTQLRHVRAPTAAKRKIDSVAGEPEASAAVPGKLIGGSKAAKTGGRPRGRPPKAKQAPKKPRAVAAKAAAALPPAVAAGASLPQQKVSASAEPAPSKLKDA